MNEPDFQQVSDQSVCFGVQKGMLLPMPSVDQLAHMEHRSCLFQKT